MRKETLQKLKNLTLKGNVATKIEEKPSDIEAVVIYTYEGLQHAAVITKDKTTDYALYKYRDFSYRIQDMHRAIKNKFSILTPWGKRAYFIAWGDLDLYRQIAFYIQKRSYYPYIMAKRIKHEWPIHKDDYTPYDRVRRAVKGMRRVDKGPEVADSIQFSNPIDDKGNPNIRLVASNYGEIKTVYCRKNVSMKIGEIKRRDNLAGYYDEFYREIDITINTNKE